MKEVGELLRAIGALLWPVFAFVIYFTYKEEFRRLFHRIRRGKVLGQEIELEQSLELLQQTAAAAALEVPRGSDADSADPVREVLETSVRSPKAALLLLASDLDREVRELLASTGWHGGREIEGVRHGFDILDRLRILPANLRNSVQLFTDMRNRLVHGHNATDDDILRAIDSGTTILQAIRSVPRQTHVVLHPGVELFSDEQAKKPMHGIKGLIFETAAPSGEREIFPTTRTHFERGMRVAWEWNPQNKYGPAWYRDPETNEIKRGWLGSMEFIGRNLDDL